MKQIPWPVMLIIIILITIYFTACAEKTYTSIDPDFRDYVQDFDRQYVGEMPNLIIQFGDVSSHAADCRELSNGQKSIYVSKALWDAYCPSQRRGMLFHELGHCVLNRDHSDNYISYMWPVIRDCDFYNRQRTALDNELFNGV